jgi:hypothetical protein
MSRIRLPIDSSVGGRSPREWPIQPRLALARLRIPPLRPIPATQTGPPQASDRSRVDTVCPSPIPDHSSVTLGLRRDRSEDVAARSCAVLKMPPHATHRATAAPNGPHSRRPTTLIGRPEDPISPLNHSGGKGVSMPHTDGSQGMVARGYTVLCSHEPAFQA